MLLMMMAMMAAEPEPWEEITINPTNPDERSLIREIQADPQLQRGTLKIGAGADGTSHGIAIKDFFKIDHTGSVWAERRDAKGDHKGLRTMTLYRVNCDNKQYGFMSGVIYNTDGSVKLSETPETYEIKMMYAVPNSVAERVIAAACKEFS